MPERTNRALREGAQRLRRVARCNVEIYSTKAKIRRRTIASSHSFDTQPPDSGPVISRIYRSPHTGMSRVPWTNLSILPSITSWTRETGKTPLFASESLVKSDGGELSDFATGPSPFPDTPWQGAQDRRNSFRPGFSSGCACRASIVPIIAEAANKATHHVVRISLHPLACLPVQFALAHCQSHDDIASPLHALGPPWLGTAASIAWLDRSVGEASPPSHVCLAKAARASVAAAMGRQRTGKLQAAHRNRN